MKKILPYILIVFTLVNFLAPVGVGLSRENKIIAERNIARAENIIEPKTAEAAPETAEATAATEIVNIKLTTSYNDKSIKVTMVAVFPYNKNTIDRNSAYVYLYSKSDFPVKSGNGVVSSSDLSKEPVATQKEEVELTDVLTTEEKAMTADQLEADRLAKDKITKTGSVTFSGLTPETLYYITGMASQKDFGWGSLYPYAALYNATAGKAGSGLTEPIAIPITTKKANDASFVEGGTAQTNNNPDPMPICGIPGISNGTIGGCLAQILIMYCLSPLPSSSH
jgi:hypothetical protein